MILCIGNKYRSVLRKTGLPEQWGNLGNVNPFANIKMPPTLSMGWDLLFEKGLLWFFRLPVVKLYVTAACWCNSERFGRINFKSDYCCDQTVALQPKTFRS